MCSSFPLFRRSVLSTTHYPLPPNTPVPASLTTWRETSSFAPSTMPSSLQRDHPRRWVDVSHAVVAWGQTSVCASDMAGIRLLLFFFFFGFCNIRISFQVRLQQQGMQSSRSEYISGGLSGPAGLCWPKDTQNTEKIILYSLFCFCHSISTRLHCS